MSLSSDFVRLVQGHSRKSARHPCEPRLPPEKAVLPRGFPARFSPRSAEHPWTERSGLCILTLGIIVSKSDCSERLWRRLAVNSQRHVLRDFAGLTFDVSIEWLDPAKSSFELLISAKGARPYRDRWQRAFQRWCDLHGQRPEVIRGNVRTNRTATRTVFVCAPSFSGFLFQWMGSEWRHHTLEEEVPPSEIQAWEIAALREQVANLTDGLRLRTNGSTGGKDLPRRDRQRGYSSRLAAFSRM